MTAHAFFTGLAPRPGRGFRHSGTGGTFSVSPPVTTCDEQFAGDDAARRSALSPHSLGSHRVPRQPGAINLRGWTAGTRDGDMT